MKRASARFATTLAYVVSFYGLSTLGAIRGVRSASTSVGDVFEVEPLAFTLVVYLVFALAALTLHMATLRCGYTRRKELSASAWLVGSILAGLIGHPMWVLNSGFWQRVRPTDPPQIQLAMVTLATVATATIIFELFRVLSGP